MITYQRHIHYYSERGDLLLDRFWLMMENGDFHDLVTVDKIFGTIQKAFCCADAQ